MTVWRGALFGLLMGCGGPQRLVAWTYEPPVADAQWTAAAASSVGVREAPLQELVQGMARRRFFGVHSIVLVHDGQVILEVHDRAKRADQAHDLRSATKSITALLVGIAADRGALDPDAPLGSHAQPRAAPQRTPRDLLTMSSGLDCDDRDRTSAGFEERMYRRGDWLAFWRDLPVSPAPEPRYCTAGVVALGGELAQRTGRPVPDFAREVLWSPLGIDSAEWQAFRGGTDTGGHLRLTPRDLAKVGQLLLNRGTWRGERVVSEAWIDAMTTPTVTLDGSDYGLLVWLGRYGGPQGDAYPLWQFRGNGGQYVFVLPEHNTVAVFTGGAYNHPDMQVPMHVMGRFVLPALGVEGP